MLDGNIRYRAGKPKTWASKQGWAPPKPAKGREALGTHLINGFQRLCLWWVQGKALALLCAQHGRVLVGESPTVSWSRRAK